MHGPAFGTTSTRAATCWDYNTKLHYFLEMIQQEDNSLIDKSDDIAGNYGFFRTFCKTSKTRARIAGIDSNTINAMNRWKTVKRAQGRRPRWTMVNLYSDARQLMPVTWRYSFVQYPGRRRSDQTSWGWIVTTKWTRVLRVMSLGGVVVGCLFQRNLILAAC